jgi:hypothetical protein
VARLTTAIRPSCIKRTFPLEFALCLKDHHA